MRIIAGKYKGRVFPMPKSIRPTQDKVRKALFDILGDIQGLSFLELFAGSGSVGLEALSRGAGEVVFVESNRQCQQVLERTLASLKPGNCFVFPAEAEAAVKSLKREKRQFDLIFLDPPYCKGKADTGGSPSKKTLQTLSAYDILAPNGFIVVQSFKKESLPHNEGDLIMFRQSRYGDTVLSFYNKQ
jgi:16S rRNA (guanine966-N2)-methyltransferase